MVKHTHSSSSKRRSSQAIRRAVWNGTLEKTPGGLRKSDLMINKAGRIVSKKKSQQAKQRAGYNEIVRRGRAMKIAMEEMRRKYGAGLGAVKIGRGPKGKELQRKIEEIVNSGRV